MSESAVPTAPIPPTVSADARERFFVPAGREARRTRFAFGALLGLVLGLHLAALGWLLYRDRTDPSMVAQAEEVPVEVVQEPPPPPPPPQPSPKNPPPPPVPQELEKPATSAPRAGSKASADPAKDTKTEAPKAGQAKAPREGQPEPSPPTASARQAAAPEVQPAEASKRAEVDPQAEPLDKAKPDLEKPNAPSVKVKAAKAKAEPADPAQQLAGLAPLPAYSFAAAAPLSEFPPGNEDNRYLAVVYAKVMSKNRYRASAAARRGLSGVVSVSFVVDYMGRVAYQAVSESSGHPDLDALAMAAVKTAAPFPSPPGSGSQQLVARMRFGPDP